MKIASVDPGIRGGIALVELSGAMPVLIDAIDIPVVGTGAKERVDVIAIHKWIERHRPDLALVERAQAMPKQGASSGFKYGRATGALEMAVILSAVPVELVEPAMWKRVLRLPGKDKEAARQRALELFPDAHHLLARKKDHGRAEAALIAFYGFKISRLMAAPPGAQTGLNIDQSSYQET